MREVPTSWNLIREAAEGHPEVRERFITSNDPVVRRTLAARWRFGPHRQDLEDAVQEVWIECFKQYGALANAQERAERAFLLGVVENVARQREARGRRDRAADEGPALEVESSGTTLTSLLDRQWARQLLIEARDGLIAGLAAAASPGASTTPFPLKTQRH